MTNRWSALASGLIVLTVGTSGFHNSGPADRASADALVDVTVYSSLPFDRVDHVETGDVVRGEKLALAQVAKRVGACRIAYKSLDDSTAIADQWDPGQTAADARNAGSDSSTIAYLGEFNSGASAVSIPILNRAGIPQVSPSNTALELTKYPGPRGHGAPAKYYPSGIRTYARVAAADHIQAGALAEWMKELHARRLYVAEDGYAWGGEIARMTAAAARLNRIRVVAVKTIRTSARDFRVLGRDVRASGADAFFFGGQTLTNAVRVYGVAYAANPRLKLFGPDGVADAVFAHGLARGARRAMHITAGDIDPSAYTAKGQQFVRAFTRAYGHKPATFAIYGYEAMSLLLDAMQRAGGSCGDRTAVLRQIFATKNKDSVLGTYSIDKDGDTTLNRFGRYAIRKGRLVFEKAVVVRRDAYGNPLGRSAGSQPKVAAPTRDHRRSGLVEPAALGQHP